MALTPEHATVILHSVGLPSLRADIPSASGSSPLFRQTKPITGPIRSVRAPSISPGTS